MTDKPWCFVCPSVLLGEEYKWLDSLDSKLSEGPKASVDAEEISEELDVSYHLCFILLAPGTVGW